MTGGEASVTEGEASVTGGEVSVTEGKAIVMTFVSHPCLSFYFSSIIKSITIPKMHHCKSIKSSSIINSSAFNPLHVISYGIFLTAVSV